MKLGLIWKYVGIYMSQNLYRRIYKSASQPTGLDGIFVLLNSYDAS